MTLLQEYKKIQQQIQKLDELADFIIMESGSLMHKARELKSGAWTLRLKYDELELKTISEEE